MLYLSWPHANGNVPGASKRRRLTSQGEYASDDEVAAGLKFVVECGTKKSSSKVIVEILFVAASQNL